MGRGERDFSILNGGSQPVRANRDESLEERVGKEDEGQRLNVKKCCFSVQNTLKKEKGRGRRL